MTGSSQDEQTQKLPVLTRTVTQGQPEVVYPEGTVKKPMGALVRFGCWVVVVLCALIVIGAIPDELVFPRDGFAALEQADGLESQVAPGWLAEGVVWYFRDGVPRQVLGNRAHFKVLSNARLQGKRRI